MANTSETFKSGELVPVDGTYECLMCRQMLKETTRAFTKGKVFDYCEGCGVKDGTWRMRPGRGK